MFIKEASLVFAETKFDLRGWDYSDPSLKILPILWCWTLHGTEKRMELIGVEVVTRRTVILGTEGV